MIERNPKTEKLDSVPINEMAIKVIGLGGVGGISARYICMYLGALPSASRVVFIDGDKFEEKNSSRMFFSSSGNKAHVTREDLLPYLKDARVTLIDIPEFIEPENAERLIRDGDWVILAVDNHATRKLVNDHCMGLRNVTLISGGNDGIETKPDGKVLRGTYGNVQISVRRNGVSLSPDLTAFHGEIQHPTDKLPTDVSCTELLESVPQILFTNLAVASAICNAFWLCLCNALHYSELALDIQDGRMQPLPLPAPQLP